MTTWLVRATVAGAVLAQAHIASGQAAPVVDLKDFRPREIKSTVFSLAAGQDLQVEAVGAESETRSGTFSWVTAIWSPGENRRAPWMGDAWILDLKSRRVMWELSSASTGRGRRSTRTFSGAVRLPAGTYEAFYSAFPTSYWTDTGDATTTRRFLQWLADEGFDDFRLTIRGGARIVAGADAERARREFENGAVVSLRGGSAQTIREAGFALSRPAQVDIYAAGEVREDGEFDSGWIINADTREKIWKLTWRDSAAAGGAAKNRLARVSKTLPPGRYAAFYATDDSHDPSAWNAPPPRDPYAWGLVVRVPDAAARAAASGFTYEHVPAAATIVALTKVGDRESLSRGFTLSRATDVRIYALGEGVRDRMVDYAWITSATGRKVWEMRYGETEHAGGGAKNRLVDRIVRLEKGDYTVHYVSDDSHSFDDWNVAAPPDGQRWGVTLLAVHGPAERPAIRQ
jgi:hypothetical protein